jgi:hypothetical protein
MDANSQNPTAAAAPAEKTIEEVHEGGAQPLAEKTIAEHAAELELEPWQLQALLARLAGKGLDLHSTISEDKLEAELTETLHGRI